MDKALKLKATLISTDGGLTWLVTRQYYLAMVSTRALQDKTLEGRTFILNRGIDNDEAESTRR